MSIKTKTLNVHTDSYHIRDRIYNPNLRLLGKTLNAQLFADKAWAWLRCDRLLGEHGLIKENRRSRLEFARNEIPIGFFWRRTDLPSLEDLEPVLHTGEGPLAFRKIVIFADEAKARVNELL